MTTRLLLTGAIVAAIALPLVATNPYTMSVVIMMLLYAYLGLAWNLIGGIGGQLSLGHSAYVGIGAYTSTLLLQSWGLTPWVGMLFGAALAAIAAVLIGLPCFRLRGAYFALATLAAAMILRIVTENSNTLLGGARGLEVPLLRDAPAQFQHTSKAFYYVIIVALTLLAVFINWWMLRSKVGYYLTAIKNDQEAAHAIGVDVARYKLIALVVSAALTAIGGTFYAQFVLFISPDKILGVNLAVQIAVICIIGGRGTVIGPILGALLLLSVEEIARRLTGARMVGLDLMLYGLMLMLVIRYEPQGLVRLVGRLRGRLPVPA